MRRRGLRRLNLSLVDELPLLKLGLLPLAAVLVRETLRIDRVLALRLRDGGGADRFEALRLLLAVLDAVIEAGGLIQQLLTLEVAQLVVYSRELPALEVKFLLVAVPSVLGALPALLGGLPLALGGLWVVPLDLPPVALWGVLDDGVVSILCVLCGLGVVDYDVTLSDHGIVLILFFQRCQWVACFGVLLSTFPVGTRYAPEGGSWDAPVLITLPGDARSEPLCHGQQHLMEPEV